MAARGANLQLQAINLENWCKRTKLTISIAKYILFCFRYKKNLTAHNFCLESAGSEQLLNYTKLRHFLDDQLSFMITYNQSCNVM